MEKNTTVQVLWVAIGNGLGLIISILSASLLSRYLSKVDYGTYKQLLYVYNSAVVVFTAGLPSVYSYFLPKLEKERGKSFINKITFILFVLGLIFSFSLFLCSDIIAQSLNNEQLAHTIKLFSVIPMFLFPSMGIDGILAAYNSTKLITINTVVSKFVLITLWVIPLFIFQNHLDYLIYGWIFASIINMALVLYLRNIPFKNIIAQVDTTPIRQIFKFSIPIVFASLAGMLITSSYQFFLSIKYGPEVFAEYSNGFMNIPIIGIVAGSLSTVLMPQFSRLMNEENGISKITQLFKSAIYKSALIIYPITIFFIAFNKEIIVILYSAKYENSAQYFYINNILNFFNIIIFSPLLLSMGKSKFYANLHIVVVIVAWILGYALYRFTSQPIYYAILSISLTIGMIIVSLYYSSLVLKININQLIPFAKLLKVIIHGFLICFSIKYILLWGFPYAHQFILFLLTGILSAVVGFASSKWVGIDYLEPINPMILKIKNRIIRT